MNIILFSPIFLMSLIVLLLPTYVFAGQTIANNTNYGIDSTEWQWNITQISAGSLRSNIMVNWSNGSTIILDLSTTPDCSAHYITYDNLSEWSSSAI